MCHIEITLKEISERCSASVAFTRIKERMSITGEGIFCKSSVIQPTTPHSLWQLQILLNSLKTNRENMWTIERIGLENDNNCDFQPRWTCRFIASQVLGCRMASASASAVRCSVLWWWREMDRIKRWWIQELDLRELNSSWTSVYILFTFACFMSHLYWLFRSSTQHANAEFSVK